MTRIIPRRAVAALASLAVLAPAAAAQAAPLYPDLRTVRPSDLRFDTVYINGTPKRVLRFSNTVENAGQGALELRGSSAQDSDIFQRIYEDTGGYSDVKVAENFIYHSGHSHYHFADFADYQLWTKRDYEHWLNGQSAAPVKLGNKASFCIMDTSAFDTSLPGAPFSAVYTVCGTERQGISVGWGDTYGWNLVDQWIVLESGGLDDGDYVLRSVADPDNLLYESANRSNSARESQAANEATVGFNVRRGKLRVSKR